MANVVGNYLRWFELKRAKKAIGAAPLFSDRPFSWWRSGFRLPKQAPRRRKEKRTGPNPYTNRRESASDEILC